METTERVVLRVGHRPGRDDRMTTHVGLTARALGADRFLLASKDTGPLERIDDVTRRFGGPFITEQIEQPKGFLKGWDGEIIHLTMYGMPLLEHIETLQERDRENDIVIVIGAEKVPFEVYELADWNIAITNQPHSEVASLGVLLDRLTGTDTLGREMKGAQQRVVPQETGKRLESVSEDSQG